jgi:leucine dehydrogenase
VALFRAFGKFIEDLRGHYITAEDSGTGLEDMEIIRAQTKHVTGIDPSHGGSGDPSPFTALGVRRGIEACVKFQLGRADLQGVHIAVQGVGHVGYHLCKELHADDTIPHLKARIVAGAANNQLAEPRHGDDLHARGILYAPDYAINAGGLVNVAQEVKGYDAKAARDKTLKIYDTIMDICERGKRLSAPTYKVADILVEEKLAAVARA